MRSFVVARYDGRNVGSIPELETVEAQLVASTRNADIWIDREVADVDRRLLVGPLSRGVQNAVFALYGLLGSLSYEASSEMAPACGANGRPVGRTTAFVPSAGELVSYLYIPRRKLGGSAGYADVNGFSPNDAAQCWRARSNELPGLIVGSSESYLSPSEISDGLFVTIPAHELQHLYSFVEHRIRLFAHERQTDLIDEGLSSLAQDLAVERMFNESVDHFGNRAAVQRYLSNPGEVSLLGFRERTGDGLKPFTLGCYGGAYLLQRFLYDSQGPTYLQNVERENAVGMRSVELALHMSTRDILLAFARFLLEPAGEVGEHRFSLRVTMQDRFGQPYELSGGTELPIGNSVEVLGGSVTLFKSSRPIERIDSEDSSIAWTQVIRREK